MKIALNTAIMCLALAGLTGCEKPSQHVEKIGAFDVETLFEKDGCKVYRFSDIGESHYFTNCGGSTMSQVSDGETSRPVTVSGGYTAQHVPKG